MLAHAGSYFTMCKACAQSSCSRFAGLRDVKHTAQYGVAGGMPPACLHLARLRRPNDLQAAQVRRQHLRHHHAPVRLLEVLQDGDDHARHRARGGVERVAELGRALARRRPLGAAVAGGARARPAPGARDWTSGAMARLPESANALQVLPQTHSPAACRHSLHSERKGGAAARHKEMGSEMQAGSAPPAEVSHALWGAAAAWRATAGGISRRAARHQQESAAPHGRKQGGGAAER